MSGKMVFREGELGRLIAELELSQEEFARLAEVGVDTVKRAMDGRPVQVRTFGKIIRALGDAGKAA